MRGMTCSGPSADRPRRERLESRTCGVTRRPTASALSVGRGRQRLDELTRISRRRRGRAGRRVPLVAGGADG